MISLSHSRFAIDSKNLGKSFGTATVLKDISFAMEGGIVVALIGANGSGKTTLLKILATLITPTKGDAFVCGFSVSRDSLQVRRRMSFVSSEERSFYWRLTARRNLRYFSSLYDLPDREATKRVDALLERVGLDQYGDTRFNDYSSGMKQLLGIARGLIPNAPVLLIDEPTKSLSRESANRVCTLIKEQAADGKAVFMASHNPEEVKRLAERVFVIENGCIRDVETVAEIRSLFEHADPSSLNPFYDHREDTGGNH